MKKLFVIKTLFMATALVCTGCSQQKSQSVAQMDSSRWIRVEDAATAQAEPQETPDINPETFLATGRLIESQGNLIQAARSYHQACQAKPDFVAAWNRLGIIYDKLGRYDQANHAFEQAIKYAPNTAYLYNNLGFSCLLAGKYEQAETHLRKALQLNQNFQRARVNLAIALGKQGQFDQALAEFKQVLPEAQAYYNLACVHRLNHNWQQAGDCYKQALDLNPNLADAETGLALCLQQKVNPKDIAVEAPLAGGHTTITVEETDTDQ